MFFKVYSRPAKPLITRSKAGLDTKAGLLQAYPAKQDAHRLVPIQNFCKGILLFSSGDHVKDPVMNRKSCFSKTNIIIEKLKSAPL